MNRKEAKKQRGGGARGLVARRTHRTCGTHRTHRTHKTDRTDRTDRGAKVTVFGSWEEEEEKGFLFLRG
jgi:hypothetical protein